MTDTQAIAVISCLCALVLVGSAVVRRRIAPRSMLALAGIWIAIIGLGLMLARLWLQHHDWPR